MDFPSTGIALLDWALRLLAAHAYLITFGMVTVENVFLVGAVVPGELTILAAGFVASVSGTDGIFAVAVFVAAVLGSVLGSNITYTLGYRGGRALLGRYTHRFPAGERRLQDAEAYFDRHGTKTLVLARFAPGIKSFAPMLAGVCRMNVAVFEIYTLAGAVLYSGLMVSLGYFFGTNLPRLLKIVQRLGWVAFGLAVLLVAAWVWERRRIIGRRQEREGVDGDEPGQPTSAPGEPGDDARG